MINIINKTNNMQTTSIHYTLVSQFMKEENKTHTQTQIFLTLSVQPYIKSIKSTRKCINEHITVHII